MTSHNHGWHSPESWLPGLPTKEDQGSYEAAVFDYLLTYHFSAMRDDLHASDVRIAGFYALGIPLD